MCEHDDGDMRAFIELRRTEDEWVAVAFICGVPHPEMVIECDKADEALIECGYVLGDVATDIDAVLRERVE